MNELQIIEEIQNTYAKDFKEKAIIRLTEVDESILDEMLKSCDDRKYMEFTLYLYDDENDPTLNTWVDVEGEGYGWIWLQEEEQDDKWHGLLKEHLLRYLENKKSEMMVSTSKSYVCIIKTDTKEIYHFVERDSSLRDTVYVFSDMPFI